MTQWIRGSLFLLTVLGFSKGFAQSKMAARHDSISNCVHVTTPNWTGHHPQKTDRMLNFTMLSLDTAGRESWRSGVIESFDADGDGFFIKVTTPAYVPKHSGGIWCTGYIQRPRKKGFDTLQVNYGVVRPGRIQLAVKSAAPLNELYLIPASLWTAKIEQSDWQTNPAQIEKFRIYISPKNVIANIDETTYVVIGKIKEQYHTAVHYTKPYIVEALQTVTLN
ncbi:hypothetical protein [Deminuibacter soli]|uniref:Uncharacterized protein n=1 Tax=Deminuibacter soli TaxID=2291815 RepID=A0A3E1NKK8_9BACT|nr:hypothetical protein [Deminuibacter soli]RFM28475.1 hypothetical protein DXN05_06615 [Deminuibacter soli]